MLFHIGDDGSATTDFDPSGPANWALRTANVASASQLSGVLAAIRASLVNPSNRPDGFTDQQWDGLKQYVGNAIQAGIDKLNERQMTGR